MPHSPLGLRPSEQPTDIGGGVDDGGVGPSIDGVAANTVECSEEAVDALRDRHGKAVVKRASLLNRPKRGPGDPF